jgi:hypothetical protein
MLYNVALSLRANQYRRQPTSLYRRIKLRSRLGDNTFDPMTCEQRDKVGVVGRAEK